MKTALSQVQLAASRSRTSPGSSERSVDFDGEKYRLASNHQREWGGELIDGLILRGEERILDLGCGDGGLTAQLASLVPGGLVVGVDSSPSMIATARRYSRSNLKFVLLDMNQLEYERDFDLVFSNAALHWVKDHRNLLARVLRALRPKGLVRFNFPGTGNCATLDRIIRQVIDQPRYAAGFEGFEWPWYMPRLEEYRLLAAQFQFRNLMICAENKDRFFPDVETMVRWIDQPCLPPFLCRLTPAEREPFRTEVVERMVGETRRPDGRCFESFRRIRVSGQKRA